MNKSNSRMDNLSSMEELILPDNNDAPILDMELALERVDGEMDLLEELAEIFLEDNQRLQQEIRTAIDNNDAEALEHAAHSLKGSVANFGAAAVTEAAFQMEGVAWENDRVGFRNYMDERNGMDIFGKTTADMVLEEVGIAGAPSYHEPGAWGMDVLKVGTSLGAGAIAYMFEDSLYRVGDSGAGSYHVVFQGPLRSRFRLDYEKWKLLNKGAYSNL